MNYKVATIPLFDKQAKRLSKKYPSLKKELADLFESLTTKPEQGKSLGSNFYKIRIAISSKGKGKSGGTRVISYVKIIETTVYLTSIYDKSDKSSIDDNELENIFKWIP
ncbi:MAG: hypothetical protein RL708_430 [Bacteroidota bacterium]|jgi:mRNA-degrading endonuclease RelE of RelBE toxin-antitoxin system